MDWANEEYVKVYRRETVDDLMLSWQARALWSAMLIKFDRSGRIETRAGARGLAVLVHIPVEVVTPAVAELLEDGRVQETTTGYFAPNFLEAQEARHTDKQRKRDERQRRADKARASAEAKKGNAQDISVTRGHAESHAVTPSHTESHGVTLSSADPELSEADPEGSLPRAILLSPGPAPAAPPPAPAAPTGWHRHSAWWTAMLEADARIRAAGVEPNAPAPPRGLAPGSPHERAIATVARNLAAGGLAPDEVDAKMRHIVAVAEAEAIRERHRRWFKPSLIWDPQRAARAADTSLEEASTPRSAIRERAGPQRSAERAPQVGRVTPAAPEEYATGELRQ